MANEWYGGEAPEEIAESTEGGSSKVSFLQTFESPSGENVLSVNQLVSSNFDGAFSAASDALKAINTINAGEYLYLDSTNNPLSTLTGIENYGAYVVDSVSVGASDTTVTVIIDSSSYSIVKPNATSVAYRTLDTITSVGNYGWAISSNGDAIFSNIVAKGSITAQSGTIGTNPYKWYIGNELNDYSGHGIIATWDHSTEYPDAGLYGVEIDSEGYFEAYAPIDIDPLNPDIFTVTTVSRQLVGGIYYYRYTTSATHNIQPGQGVFISGLTRYNNSSVSSNPAPVFATTTNTFDIDEMYILDSYTTNLTSQNGSVRKAQRVFGISSGNGDSMLFPDGISEYPPSGIYFANSTRTVGTYIASSGKSTFRGINPQTDELTPMYIEIDPERTDIALDLSGYINVGPLTIRNDTIGMTLDNNEIQGFFESIAGGIAYKSANQITINALGGNVNIGKGGGSQTITIHGAPVNINTSSGTNADTGNIYLGHYTSATDKSSVFAPAVYYQTQSARAVYVGAAGVLGTVASSRRVKSDINIADISEEVDSLLNLELVTFKYNNEIEELGLENAEVKLGFIAEQAQELGLTYLYEKDEEGIANYFAYDRLPLYMFIKMKRQENKINELEQRLAILEG